MIKNCVGIWIDFEMCFNTSSYYSKIWLVSSQDLNEIGGITKQTRGRMTAEILYVFVS